MSISVAGSSWTQIEFGLKLSVVHQTGTDDWSSSTRTEISQDKVLLALLNLGSNISMRIQQRILGPYDIQTELQLKSNTSYRLSILFHRHMRILS